MKKWITTLLLALSVSALLVGCKKDTTEEEPKTEKQEVKKDTHEGEAKSLLTGKWIDAVSYTHLTLPTSSQV